MAGRAKLREDITQSSGTYSAAARLLGLRAADPHALNQAVRAGFAYASLRHFVKETKLPLSEVSRLIQVPERTLVRRKTEGRLQPDESDRLFRASRITGRAIELFDGNVGAARQWLERPQRALGNIPPLEFAATDVGAAEVEALIARLEYGILA
jgi:putative toxin-antitoxin system antitoxin component (TIGR02293 family)